MERNFCKILIVDDDISVCRQLALALNSSDDDTIVALNFELASGDAPPSTIMLVPAGRTVIGRDGRSWNNLNPQTILDFFSENGLDIPVDVEHATQLKAPKGEAAPAMAWGKSLDIHSDGSVWGNFDWNQAGSDLVVSRQYRYYSPAYIIDKQTMNIVGIKSVGLTNTPNLEVPALNQKQEKGGVMVLATLLAALGLSTTASFDDAINSIGKMKGDLTVALNSATAPPLDKFVPKADYDLALNRASDAEGKLATLAKEQLETAINHEIDAALAAGKITPGTKDYHIAQCRQAGGLDRFKAFVGVAPVVAADVNLEKKLLGTDTALNAEDKAACVALGISEEDFIKANQV